MLVGLLLLSGLPHGPLRPVVSTEPVAHDADDPAIWIAPDSSKSLILGTDKAEKTGALYVFNLEGKIVQKVEGLDRPNNVDVEQGVKIDDELFDLAVVTERGAKRLRVFSIDRKTGVLTDVSGKTGVFQSRTASEAVPMGIGLMKGKDGSLWAVVSPKGGPREGYLEARPLVFNEGKFDLGSAIQFGDFSGSGEIESVFADDKDQKVYYSDESASLCQVDLATPAITKRFAQRDYSGDREGLARYKNLLLSSDQIEGGSKVHVFDIASLSEIAVITTVSDSTDGLDCTERRLGSKFPKGLLVMMNSKEKNFLLYDWRDIEGYLPID